MTDHGDPFSVRILALRHELHRGAEILREIGKASGFRTSSALTDASLVVAQHEEALIGQPGSQLTEDRDARDDLVAISLA